MPSPERVARVAELRRYPVKSMAADSLETVVLGWHGLEGDRRWAYATTVTPGRISAGDAVYLE